MMHVSCEPIESGISKESRSMPQRVQHAVMREEHAPKFGVGLLSLVLLGTTVAGASSFASQDVTPDAMATITLGNVPKSSNTSELDKLGGRESTIGGAASSANPGSPEILEATLPTATPHPINTKAFADFPIVPTQDTRTTADGREVARSQSKMFPLNQILRLIFFGTLFSLVMWRLKPRSKP